MTIVMTLEPEPTKLSDSPACSPASPAIQAAIRTWQLVQRAQQGDQEAVTELYKKYQSIIFRYIYFRVSDRHVAEDLTSDTFYRGLRRIGSFQWQGRDFGAWLVTIAHNLLADHFKSGRYRQEVVTADVADGELLDCESTSHPEGAAVEHLTNLELLRAVLQLSDEQRECIVLRFLRGLSTAETAAAMGKNTNAIKALQYRGVRALARLLPPEFLEAHCGNAGMLR